MTELLVTGGRGFIGRHVVEQALLRGHTVRVLGRPGTGGHPTGRPDLPREPSGVEVVEHDLRNPDGLARSLRGVDAVIHCAAAMGGSAAEQEAVTVGGTRHLLAAMREAGVGRIVHLGSLAVYDYMAIREGDTLTEESPIEAAPGGRSPYAGLKLLQEEMVRDAGRAEGWNWTILRPGIVMGEDRTWFHHLGMRLDPHLWITLAGRGALPLTYVEGCADAVVRALDTPAAHGTILNVVDDALPSRSAYATQLLNHLEVTPRIIDLPWRLLAPPARLGSSIHRAVLRGRGPLPDVLRTPRLAARCKPLRYSNERAKSVLSWSPPLDFVSALDRSFGGAAPPL